MRFLWVMAFLLSCSSGRSLDLTEPSIELKEIGVSRTILTSEKRLISYVKDIGRLSLIATDKRQEVWGRDVPGYDAYFAMPNFSGAALYNSSELLITEELASRSFTIVGFASQVTAANDALAYSFANEDGSAFKLIRLDNNGRWQEEVFNIPWTASASDETYLKLVTIFDSKGSSLLALAPEKRQYAIYKLNQDDQLIASTATCGTSENHPPLRSFLWHETLQLFFVADQAGNLYAINPADGCKDWDELDQISLAEKLPIISLADAAANELIIGQHLNLSVIQYSSGEFQELAKHPVACSLPIGSLKLSEQELLLACKIPTKFYSPEEIPPVVQVKNIRQYMMIDLVIGETNIIEIPENTVAGSGVDMETRQIYIMKNSSLGIFEHWDLKTGSRQSEYGLFLNGLLDGGR